MFKHNANYSSRPVFFRMCVVFLLSTFFFSCTKKSVQVQPAKFQTSHSVPDVQIDGDFVRGQLIEDAKEEIKKISSPLEKVKLLEKLASLYATTENGLVNALSTYQEARALARDIAPDAALDVLAKIGIVQLRIGELMNCNKNHNSESCIFPLSAMALHKDKAGSEAALASFTEYLKSRPDDIHVQWLAEVVSMTLGRPVSKKWLKDKEQTQFPRFKDLAGSVGLYPGKGLGAGGVIVEDFNGDGYLDVIISSTLVSDSLHYFENDRSGRFVDKTISAGLDQILPGALNLGPTDFNNDGKIDIYISRRNSRGLNKKLKVYNALLKNNGNGTFSDVTEKVGLKTLPNSNVAAAWADYDNDGWLDLFVCNENRGPDLFHNEHGHFAQVIINSGISNKGICGGAIWGDVNNDGFSDLFLTNLNDASQLFLNQKDGTFRKSNQPVLETGPRMAYNTGFFDFNNDGWLDIFVAAFEQNINHMLSDQLGKKQGDHQRLFRNSGHGSFQDVTAQVGLDKSIKAMGGNLGDLDNDGYPDIFLGTGGHSLGDIVPNVVFLNGAGKSFADVAVAGGFSHLQGGHGVSFTDLDNDGQPDIVMSLGGAYDSARAFPQFLHNPGFRRHWITLRLQGTKSKTNKLGIGARVKATINEKSGSRTVYAVCGKGATFGANSLQVHLGLGTAENIEKLEITWPGYIIPQQFKNVKVDKFYEAIQDKQLRPLTLKKIHFVSGKHQH